MHGETMIFINITSIYTIIQIGQIGSILYKAPIIWASGGIGRRVGLRNQQPNPYIPTTAYFLAIPVCFI